jgi:hypothetical protein
MPTSITSSGITFDDATTLTTGVIPTANIGNSAVTAAKLQNGCVVQVVQTVVTTLVSCATLIPLDDTVPQNNEGDEIFTASITPSSATSKILVRVTVHGGASSGFFGVALFRDNDASAIAATFKQGAGYEFDAKLEWLDSPNTPSAVTYKVRAGSSAGTFYLNGNQTGTRRYGGACKSNITLMEIKA